MLRHVAHTKVMGEKRGDQRHRSHEQKERDNEHAALGTGDEWRDVPSRSQDGHNHRIGGKPESKYERDETEIREIHTGSFLVPLRCRCRSLELGWTLGKQRLCLKWSLTRIVAFDDDLNAWSENIGYDATINDR